MLSSSFICTFLPHKWCFIDNKYLFLFLFCYTLNPCQSLIRLITYNLYLCLLFMLFCDCVLKTSAITWWLAFSVLVLNINVSNGLNLISTLRSVKNPKSQQFCSFATVLSISMHLYLSHNGEVFIWTLYALTWMPERRQTWYHIIQRK